MKIYLAGCGKIGTRLGYCLQNDGHQVIGLKRTPKDLGFSTLSIDLSNQLAVQALPKDAEVIIFMVTPPDYTEVDYKHVYDTILNNLIDFSKQHSAPPLFLLVSSTSLYGQQKGQWVNEDSTTKPRKFNGQWILQGEKNLRQQLSNSLCVRFSGIYATHRARLIKTALSGKPIQQNPPLWTNRLHEDDCVNVLYFLIKQYQSKIPLDKIYLVSDNTPVSSYDIIQFICQRMGKPHPKISTENISYQQNKRCDNTRIKRLGYRFIYPTYQIGYRAILDDIATQL
ncbi:MAG: sugar nucleotide-binding protein [Ostreibacterium sp.]